MERQTDRETRRHRYGGTLRQRNTETRMQAGRDIKRWRVREMKQKS
jgi:hypothetical protein